MNGDRKRSSYSLVRAAILSACSQGSDPESYEAVAARTWRAGSLVGIEGAALGRELVRYATLAPSSHNTQCWMFELDDKAITILPDLSRRCPAVDPDDHHVFVSLGCAAENLIRASLAHGFNAEVGFDTRRDAVRVTLGPTPAQVSALFKAIPARQSTRGDYDGKPSRQHRPDGGPCVRQGAQGVDPLQRHRCGSHQRRPVQRVVGQPRHSGLAG